MKKWQKQLRNWTFVFSLSKKGHILLINVTVYTRTSIGAWTLKNECKLYSGNLSFLCSLSFFKKLFHHMAQCPKSGNQIPIVAFILKIHKCCTPNVREKGEWNNPSKCTICNSQLLYGNKLVGDGLTNRFHVFSNVKRASLDTIAVLGMKTSFDLCGDNLKALCHEPKKRMICCHLFMMSMCLKTECITYIQFV